MFFELRWTIGNCNEWFPLIGQAWKIITIPTSSWTTNLFREIASAQKLWLAEAKEARVSEKAAPRGTARSWGTTSRWADKRSCATLWSFLSFQGITKPAIRRLARRGGVKRISGLIYEETRGVLKVHFSRTGIVMHDQLFRCSLRMSSAMPWPTPSMPRGRPSRPWMLSTLWRGRAGPCTALAARNVSQWPNLLLILLL